MSHLLDLELTTLYLRSADGSLERERRASETDFVPPPVVAVASGAEGLVWACGAALPAPIVAEVDARLRAATEPSGRLPDIGWWPQAGEAILGLLPDGGSWRVDTGPSYVAPLDRPAATAATTAGVELRTNDDTDAEGVRSRLPERDAVLDPPWVVAIVDGVVAAVCETARSAPSSVEAGVWTYDAHRRQGLASLVTASWLDVVQAERTAFYSTSADNLASQGVARRLGLTPIGQWWQVRSATSR